MLNKQLIERKINSIFEDLQRLKSYLPATKSAFLKDIQSQDSVERVIERLVGRAIDINQHIIVEVFPLKVAAPMEYRETFIKIGEMGVLPDKFAERISQSAGFRNRLVHGYETIDERKVYDSAIATLEDFPQYCDYILQFLKKEKHS